LKTIPNEARDQNKADNQSFITECCCTYIAKPVPQQIILNTCCHHATLQVPRIPLTHMTQHIISLIHCLMCSQSY